MSAIKAGDLVMPIKPLPCGCHGTTGVPFVVAIVLQGRWHCATCLTKFQEAWLARRPDGSVATLDRLIKIDPPALPESTERKEELTA